MTEQNARYEGNWYYCWLIERRDLPQPEWLGEYDWTKDANEAVWYARKSDADKIAGDLIADHRVVVCEHGFMLSTTLTTDINSLPNNQESVK